MANELEDVMVEDEAADTGGSRVYELGFHLDPGLPTEEMKKAYRQVREVVEGKSAIVAEGEPTMVQLAYTISRQETSGRRDFDSAYFSWIVYETSAANHADVVAAAAADTRIIRFIDLVTTKDAARHSQELRELSLKLPEQNEDPEAVAGAELDAAIESAAI